MAEDNEGLDSFLTGEGNTSSASKDTTEEINLEDEFAKLLNDFVNHSGMPSQPSAAPIVNTENTASAAQAGGLDGMITPQNNTSVSGLDDLVTSPQPQTDVGLDGFVTSAPAGLDNFVSGSSPVPESGGLDSMVTLSESTPNAGGLDGMITPVMEQNTNTSTSSGLKEEERELAQKIKNFQDSMSVISMKKNLKNPTTDYVPEMLIPNYKPSIGKKIAEYLLASWDIINKYAPEDMKRLPPDADDEGYLSFAETLNDADLQLAIISYVEILIDIEICEVSYEQKKEIMIKNRIKKELYEEYMALQERKKLFIAKLKEKNFPIDVEKLMNNYFRAAKKDPDSSFEALTKNPAMFAPIQMEKIKPKFFGLIKVTPEDGIKANQKIGSFIKKLKV